MDRSLQVYKQQFCRELYIITPFDAVEDNSYCILIQNGSLARYDSLNTESSLKQSTSHILKNKVNQRLT